MFHYQIGLPFPISEPGVVIFWKLEVIHVASYNRFVFLIGN
jgi:hypothetical protein